jgi:hypothetical protein
MSPVNNKETQTIAKTLRKKLRQAKDFPHYHSQIIYMKQSASKSYFKNNVKAGDVIEIHAEGWPWGIGSLHSDDYDYTAFELAYFFYELLGSQKEIQLTIEIRACNSGTIATGFRENICFAQDFSEALSFYGFENIEVKGYTGYVQSENPFKQSVVGHAFLSRAKIPHCNLESGEVTYQDGIIKKPAQKIIVSDYEYTLEEMDSLKQYFEAKHAFAQSRAAYITSQALVTLKEEDEVQDCNDNVEIDGICTEIIHKLKLSTTPTNATLNIQEATSSVEIIEPESRYRV